MNKTYYEEKLETLSEDLQYAIMMSHWQEVLIKIQNQFKLHIDQTQVLEDSTIKLMFGDIDAPTFINRMFDEADINSEMAADILLEVDLKILKEIRKTLEMIEDGKKDEEEIENFLLDDEEKKARIEAEAYAKYYAEIEKIREEDDSNPEDVEEEEIPTDIDKERIDLLKEINEPTKSFTEEIIPVDHQIENIHIEKPIHIEDFENDIVIDKPTTTKSIKKETVSTIKKPIDINLNDIYREPIE